MMMICSVDDEMDYDDKANRMMMMRVARMKKLTMIMTTG